MKKALVIAGGSVENIKLCEDYDIIICADSGYDNSKKLGLSCDVYVGDMDSVHSNIECEEKMILPTEKDLTDTEAALSEAVKRGYNHIALIGALGSRCDHAMANIGLLKKYLLMGVKVVIIDSNNVIEAINSQMQVIGKKGDTFSIIPADSETCGITLVGFKYPLNDATLKIGETVGISNVIIEDNAFVSVKKGVLYTFLSHD